MYCQDKSKKRDKGENMGTLYELTGAYQQIYEMTDEELESDVWFDTLESIDEEIEIKADGYAKLIKQLDSDEKMLADEIKRLQEKKASVQNKKDRMKRNLENAMIETGKTKFKTLLFSFGIQKNVPSVKIEDEQAFIEKNKNYTVEQAPKIDKKTLLLDLKAGVQVDGAEIMQSESLRIR